MYTASETNERENFNIKMTNDEKAHANTRDSYTYKQHCSKCGIKHDQNKCPAEGKTCAKCKKLNHFARMCKSKLKLYIYLLLSYMLLVNMTTTY
jgi:hypothetical protein